MVTCKLRLAKQEHATVITFKLGALRLLAANPGVRVNNPKGVLCHAAEAAELDEAGPGGADRSQTLAERPVSGQARNL